MALFCDAALAERIERFEVARIVGGARPHGFVFAIGGGYATFAERGSPLNKVVGLGFGGVPEAAEWDAVEYAFAKQGAPVQVELAHLGDPEIAVQLTARGTGSRASKTSSAGPSVPHPCGCRPRGSRSGRAAATNSICGWTSWSRAPRSPKPPAWAAMRSSRADVIARAVRALSSTAGMRRYLALCDGVPAGGASVCFADGLAALTGAATLGAYRRRGIQSALLAQRLADAAEAGCDLATVTTSPATKSQQNAQRQGFELLYTRVVLVRDPQGSR